MREWQPRIAATAILASAGSGKTFQLSNEYIRLLLLNVPAERVLATTFTRKAAGEIQDRVLSRLADGAASAETARSLGEHLGQPGLTPQRCREVLARFVRSLHLASIGTIDAFFARLASVYEMDLDLPVGWSIGSDHVQRTLLLDSIAATVEQAEPSELLQLLRSLHEGGYPSQVGEAVEREVIRAHAVAMKTARDAWNAVPRRPNGRPLQPDELAQALERLAVTPALADGASKEDASLLKARDTVIREARAARWVSVASSKLAQAALVPGGTYARKTPSPSLVAALVPLVEHAIITAQEEIRDANRAMRVLTDRFHSIRYELQHARGVFAFDDIPRKLIQANAVGNLEDLFYRLDSRIDHVLLDEFQDTSLEQFALLRPLVEEILSGGEGSIDRNEASAIVGRSVFFVGDVKQSMYAWRDAEPELFAEVLAQWPQIQRRELHESRRSSQVVLDAVNTVFSTLSTSSMWSDPIDQTTAQAWESGFTPHTAAKHLEGCVRVHVVRPPRDDEVASLVRLRAAAERVQDLSRSAPRATIGVLLPARKHIARLIFELKQRGITASEEGGNPLTDSPAVAAVLSALQIIDHPSDRAARFHVATTPLGDLLSLERWRDDRGTLEISIQLRDRILRHGLASLLRECRAALVRVCTARDVERLAQLVELAEEHEASMGTRLREFVELVHASPVESPTQERVRVMTIHRSKGLEFDAVVLPDLDCGMLRHGGLVTRRRGVFRPIDAVSRYPSEPVRALFPDLAELYAQSRSRDLRERLCVLYVAMTRARHALEIFIDAKSTAQPPHYSQIIRSAFAIPADFQGGSSAYERGTQAWTRAFEGEPSRRPIESPIRVRLHSREERPTRALPIVSPSSLHASKPVAPDDQPLLKMPGHIDAARLGSLVHAALEHVEWLVRLPATAHALANRIAPDDQREREALHALLARSFEHPEISRLLSQERYSEWKSDHLLVRREVRLAARDPLSGAHQECLLAGFVDRLVVGMRGGRAIEAEVIDYKTDDVPSSQIDERRSSYAPQVDAYRRIVSQQFALNPSRVRGTLVFLRTGHVMSWT